MRLMVEVRKLSRAKEPFKPTKKKLWYWFNKINAEVFEGKLKKFRKVQFLKCRTMWAISYGVQIWSKTKKKQYLHTDLIIKDSFRTEKQFVDVLAHEMVHHWQWSHSEAGMTHGQTFWMWKEALEKHNIILTENINGLARNRKHLPVTFEKVE